MVIALQFWNYSCHPTVFMSRGLSSVSIVVLLTARPTCLIQILPRSFYAAMLHDWSWVIWLNLLTVFSGSKVSNCTSVFKNRLQVYALVLNALQKNFAPHTKHWRPQLWMRLSWSYRDSSKLKVRQWLGTGNCVYHKNALNISTW